MRKLLLFTMIICSFLSLSSLASACVCINESPMQTFKRLRRDSDAIFIGEAIGRTPKGSMTFKVEKYWKGKLTREVLVYTAADSSCAVDFGIGGKYLIFAIANEWGEYDTDQCMMPKPVNGSDTYLRRLGKGKVIKPRWRFFDMLRSITTH